MSSEEKKGEERQACDGFIPTAPHILPFMLNNVSQRHWPTPFNSRPILSGALFFLYEEEKRRQINDQNLSVQTSVGRIRQGESVNMIASVIKKRRRGGARRKPSSNGWRKVLVLSVMCLPPDYKEKNRRMTDNITAFTVHFSSGDTSDLTVTAAESVQIY